MKWNILLAVGLVIVCGLAAQAEETQPDSKKPPYERLLQGDDAKLADELLQKANDAEGADQYDKAVKYAEELLALRTRAQGADHWETVDKRWELDARRKAAALSAEMRTGWRKTLRAGFLAGQLDAKGQYAEAAPLWQEYHRGCLQVFGEKHPYTARGYNNLGVILDQDQGKYAEALPLIQKALDIRLELLGEKHPSTAISYNNLARSLEQLGKHADARQYLLKSLAICIELFGEKNENIALIYNNLAVNLESERKYSDAEPIYQKALDLRIELLGEKHHNTAFSYYNRARNLQVQGKYALALPLYQKALRLRRELLGEKHRETAASYSDLASNLFAQGKYAEAQPFFQRALDLHIELLGEKNPETAACYGNLASDLNAQEKYADALPICQKALSLYLELRGENHPDTARGFNNLASHLESQGMHAAAQPLFQRALNINVTLLGELHLDTAISFNNLARNLDFQGKHIEAQSISERALGLRSELLGENHPDTTNSLGGLAANLVAQRKYADAKVRLAQATASYEAARLIFGGRGLDRGVFGAQRSPYPLLAATEAQLCFPAAAWNAAESDLARGLSDEFAFHRGTPLTTDEHLQRGTVSSRLLQLQPRILQLVSKQSPTDSEKDELAELRKERNMLETKLAELAAKISLLEVEVLAGVQAAIPIDAALVLWVDVAGFGGSINEHWGCVIRGTGDPKWERLPGSGADGNWTDDDSVLPRQLRTALAFGTVSQEDVDHLAKELYTQRLAPLARHLGGVKTLYVAGVNKMAGIPIEVLTRDFTISYVPSGTFLARLPKIKSASQVRLLAVGDPAFTRPDADSEPKPSTDLPPGGLLITMVAPDGAAAKAQLKPGDVLVHYGDAELNSVEQLTAAIQAAAPRKEVPITVWREGENQPFTRIVPSGRLGVALDKVAARVAIANRRQTDAMLASLRGGNYNELPGTRVELMQLGNLFGDETTSLLDSAASEQSLDDLRKKGDLSKFRYIHFATHGETNNVKAFESVLILARDDLAKNQLPRAGEPFINGQLSANEVLEFWDLNADLVTLSACDTALGRQGGGDGLLGFAQAFLTAGSRAVCLSLWKVDDTATALLMTRFYQNMLGKREGLKQPMGKARALAEAKDWLRELSAEEADKLLTAAQKGIDRPNRIKGEPLKPVISTADSGSKPFAHPRFWSAFILIGDPN